MLLAHPVLPPNPRLAKSNTYQLAFPACSAGTVQLGPSDVIRIDPVRMAHGILTGIGFLCGGVIFREAFSVRGLNTAASLWMTASLGILFGVGFYTLAIAGAATTICVLAAVRASEILLPQRRYANIKIRFLRSATMSPKDFRDRLCASGLQVTSMHQRMDSGGIEFSATVIGDSEEKMGWLIADLRSDNEVTGFDYTPHDV